MSAIVKGGVGAGAAALGVSLSGWPAAVVIGVLAGAALLAVLVLLLWVLGSDARTGRVLSIITALRVQRR